MTTILSLIEQEHGEPLETSLEVLTLARELASETDATLSAVVFGDEGAAIAEAVGTYGVEEIHHVTHDGLTSYAPQAWGEAVAQLARELETEAIAVPGTDRGHEVLAHVGATLDLPMAANCIDIAVGDDGYEITRHRWGGSLIEQARLVADTALVSAAEHEYPIEAATEATDPVVTSFTPTLDAAELQVSLERLEEADIEGVPLGEARVVIGGGRGVGGPEGYDQLEELADLLGGAVGASRAAVNEGWRPHDDQIGLTGAMISPDLYIACGISGAVQHMVGCKGVENILAINTDPEAAIIQKGEYAVIGDLHEVVPALNEAIRAEQ